MVVSVSVWCGMNDDMLISHIILDDCVTGCNYLDFLQNGISEQLEMFWLHRLLCTFSMMESLVIIPDL
jgi:hypothetical protein